MSDSLALERGAEVATALRYPHGAPLADEDSPVHPGLVIPQSLVSRTGIRLLSTHIFNDTPKFALYHTTRSTASAVSRPRQRITL